jgi:hypothetical protein
MEFFHCITSKDDAIGCALSVTVNFELVFEQATGGKFSKLDPNVCFSCGNISSSLGCPFVFPGGSSLIFFLTGSGIEDLQIIEELDPQSIRARRYLYHFVTTLASTLIMISGTLSCFGDDILIIVVNAVLFFEGKVFIIGLRMVGSVLAAVIRSFLLSVAFFPLLLRACQILVVALLIVLTIMVVSVVVILLVVVVAVAVPIIVTGIVGIYSFWILRVATFSI